MKSGAPAPPLAERALRSNGRACTRCAPMPLRRGVQHRSSPAEWPTALLIADCPVLERRPRHATNGACLAVARPSQVADTRRGAGPGSRRFRLPRSGGPKHTGGSSQESGTAAPWDSDLPPPRVTYPAVARSAPVPHPRVCHRRS